MQYAHGDIAGRDIVHHHTKTENIGHLGKAQMLFQHFFVNGIDVLFASADAGLYARGSELFAYRIQNAIDHFTSVATRRTHCLGHHLVAQRVQIGEGQFLQFAVQAVQAEAVGNRGVDLGGFACNPATLFRRHRIQRPHIVQTVGQLDEDDANIARHGQQHLAKVFCLGIGG